MNSEACEKLSVVCASLFGITTLSAVSISAGAFGGGAALLAMPAVIRSFRKAPGNQTEILIKLRKTIELDWQDWARASGELTAEETAAAVAALDHVLLHLDPDPSALMRAGRDEEKLIALALADARRQAPEDFAGSSAVETRSKDPFQADINASFLRSMLRGAAKCLNGDPLFEAALTPHFHRELFERLRRIEDALPRMQHNIETLITKFERLEAALSKVVSKMDALGPVQPSNSAELRLVAAEIGPIRDQLMALEPRRMLPAPVEQVAQNVEKMEAASELAANATEQIVQKVETLDAGAALAIGALAAAIGAIPAAGAVAFSPWMFPLAAAGILLRWRRNARKAEIDQARLHSAIEEVVLAYKHLRSATAGLF